MLLALPADLDDVGEVGVDLDLELAAPGDGGMVAQEELLGHPGAESPPDGDFERVLGQERALGSAAWPAKMQQRPPGIAVDLLLRHELQGCAIKGESVA